jgi:hypothetical protein
LEIRPVNENQVSDVIGSTAYGSDGQKIGKVGQVYFDESTDQPEWVTVNTGLFGTSESFIPLSDATFEGDRLTVSPHQGQGEGRPERRRRRAHLARGGARAVRLLRSRLGRLLRHHDDHERGRHRGLRHLRADHRRRHDAVGGAADVGTRQEQVGRARLRKWVETEHVTQTVPVRKERAVLETEPITEENYPRSVDGPEITEAEHEVTLHEERPVVQKTVEPVERVRLGTETVQSEETITEEVRSERVDVDGDGDLDQRR